ncbi:MAG: hypothetical protein PHH28_07965 [Desulfuromonadaceae bacterium]|nr:hypothetical protein [Desulfuromonadaceae bacterium]
MMTEQTPETVEKSRALIEDSLADLQIHIREYRAYLNEESIWLFLATLGCWSVAGQGTQFIALSITVILFGRRLSEKLADKRSFTKIILSLEARITAELPNGDTRKARLYDLAQLKKDELSSITALKKNWVFLLCWGFYALTFAHNLGLFVAKAK